MRNQFSLVFSSLFRDCSSYGMGIKVVFLPHFAGFLIVKKCLSKNFHI